MDLPLQRYWQLLARYLRPLRLKVLLLAGLIFGGISLQLVNPQIIRFFIDGALANQPEQTLVWVALAYLAASLVLQAVNVAATYVGEDIGWRATNHLRADLAIYNSKLNQTGRAQPIRNA